MIRKRAAILDDDREFAEILQKKLRILFVEFGFQFELEIFTDPKVLDGHAEQFDLLFLDIMLEDADGIQWLQKWQNRGYFLQVIYVSAYEREVFRSFENHPIAFVRKAYLTGDLKTALRLYQNFLDRKEDLVMVPEGQKQHIFHADEIIYLLSNNHYIEFFMLRGEKQIVRGKMDDMERLFWNHGFLRIHISYLVNLKYVSRIEKNQICMKNGACYRISTKYKGAIEEQLRRYFEGA